jgi:HD-like signal output (HDOD) protein
MLMERAASADGKYIEWSGMATRPSSALEKPKAWRPEGVPPFPAVALKALNLMAGRDTSLLELCNLIRSDLAFSTEVLRIANSPLVAFSKGITSVMQASILLGFRRLRSIVITVGLKAYLAEAFRPELLSCWRHSLACAIIAERAAKACALDKDFAYTAGVMHDLGRVVLAVSMPLEYARVVERGADEPRDLLETERELCGIDHCEAGGTLVKEWRVPEAFSRVTSCHHDANAGATGVESIVPLSCLLADSLGFGVVVYRSPRSYGQVLSDFPEAARGGFPAEERDLASGIASEIRMIESA